MFYCLCVEKKNNPKHYNLFNVNIIRILMSCPIKSTGIKFKVAGQIYFMLLLLIATANIMFRNNISILYYNILLFRF